ncbi:MAG: deoxyribodipyrimidine photolyase [Pseudomonadota bacterium]|nr:deoxyribodipyrimidine photolyase [Pseudomonadota bacterium]
MAKQHKTDLGNEGALSGQTSHRTDRGIIPPTIAAARARIEAVQPTAYARTRNALDGAVSGLSPYITHGLVTLQEVLAGVDSRHALDAQHKFVYELGWREFFRHVWQHRGDEIFDSFHAGPLPDQHYAKELPADIRQACTGVPVVDMAVRELYASGTLHNHARMWLASYVVHVRKVHWRVGADWLYGHLLDGDLASNHLSWQWVAGTGSGKPYLFNAENVARYAPADWHSPGSIVDTSYEALDRIATDPHARFAARPNAKIVASEIVEPAVLSEPPEWIGATAPDAALVERREVWLVHPWNLGDLPADLPPNTLVIALFLSDFHRAWPWSQARWDFVATRMAALTTVRWHGAVDSLASSLSKAARVRCRAEPHLMPWLPQLAECLPVPTLFPAVDRSCSSFSQWWQRASRGLKFASELLPATL